MASSLTVEVRGLTKEFGDRAVLRELDLDIAPGEFVALLGLKALDEVRLADHAEAWPRTLSGGEAQRVSLARALVREPELLLLDEPFGALDALTRMAMHRLVETLWQQHKPAVLLVTHDVDEALLLADRVLVLDEGRIASEYILGHPRPRELSDHIDVRAQVLRDLGVNERATA
ncbi:ATP-binding cassette domain-containing protein [Actinokineospora cianjurensis]|uniref:ABC transporter family protein n=1 Tax=Actinokineospora cianjurensis TaxID=585224 RepID=A0A421B7M0_9PSEU|nr:ATP-binding cassette domain-containing protein [Actinokineospora cianjurensis]RLK60374.1 ABC transporter family protein [Actinokineospora cianjurensis]